MIDVGTFKNKSELTLLNMDFFHEFQGFFDEKNMDTKQFKEVYLLPNFIRDCCVEIGYHGVRYTGVHQENGKYTNYA
ncbi:hypothetical protein MLOOGBEN_21635 [Bacillus sp. EB106-08-02-XG196]|nr:hypothetical protein [Bacillus sp. EB106-08-02-XG196]